MEIKYQGIGVSHVINLIESLCDETKKSRYTIERHGEFILIIHVPDDLQISWEYYVCKNNSVITFPRHKIFHEIMDPETGQFLAEDIDVMAGDKVIWSPWLADIGILLVPKREVPWTLELCFHFLKERVIKRICSQMR